MGLLDNFVVASGRIRRENGQIINQADLLNDENDRLTGGKKVINTDHYYIHRGIAYKAFILLDTVAATPVEYSFKTPPELFPHFKNLSVTALGGTLRVTVKRGTTANPLVIDSAGSDPGTELTGPHNLNDTVDKLTGVVIRKSPTYVTAQSGEDWIKVQLVGDSTNQFTSVADLATNDNEEVVMNPDTYYTLRLERIGGDSPGQIALSLFWYEEPQGNL